MKTVIQCLVCQSPVEEFISFGRMPIANGFLPEERFADERFFELKAGFCPGCTMVQLTERVDPEALFHEEYAYFSSTSVRMVASSRLSGRVSRASLRYSPILPFT